MTDLFAQIGGRRIEYRWIDVTPRERAPLVLLHEGLGSIAMWRDFPETLAHATARNVLVYSRYGYGNSESLTAHRDIRYMHDEALVALPELLDQLDVETPLLVGHSDGGSIALIHAGAGIRDVAGVVTLAAHVLVEDLSIASIAKAKVAFETTDLRTKLARYHADVESAFLGWNRIWLDPAFREWNIEEYLARISCPVLAIQGNDDEYGTMDQMRRIGAQVRDVDLLALADCRHSPHRDQPQAVLAAITRFADRIA